MTDATDATEAPASAAAKGSKVGAKGPRSMLPFVVVGTAIAIAASLMLARGLLAGSYKVPSASMIPTIAVGEHVLVNKTDKNAGRGKVLVFKHPENLGVEYVKRVVGMPGDVVEVRGTSLLVNGKSMPTCDVGAWSYEEAGGPRHEGMLVVENLDGEKHLVFHEHLSLEVASSGPWTVKPGEAFMMGDNRENSHDSRMWFHGTGGGVPFGNVIGTVRPQGAIGLPLGAEALKEKLKACVARL